MKSRMLIALAFALGACGRPDGAIEPAGAKPACAPGPNGAVTVENAWVRAQSDASGMSAAYFTLCNGSAQSVTLDGISTPLAGLVELHETVRDPSGIVSMAPTGPITVAAGETLIFEPGGKHAMLMNLAAAIAEGEIPTLTIELAGGQTVPVEAAVISATKAAEHSR